MKLARLVDMRTTEVSFHDIIIQDGPEIVTDAFPQAQNTKIGGSDPCTSRLGFVVHLVNKTLYAAVSRRVPSNLHSSQSDMPNCNPFVGGPLRSAKMIDVLTRHVELWCPLLE